jgi:iron complex outermembrane receptor protein
MRQIFMTAFMLVWTVMSFGQHLIKGKVIDENGGVLQGAAVFIKSENRGKTTDKNGDFIFDGLGKTRYTIDISFLGYENASVQAVVDRELVVRLSRKTFTINEVTVSSLRANDRSAVAYSDVKKEDIAQRNLGQDIPYLLALTPSFIATSDAGTGIGYTGFRIRGTDANRTNITVNGVPLNDAESHGTFFVNMPDFASSLSSMQVQRGVGTSTNGAAAFGASINMQTEGLNAKPYAEISSTYGSFNTNKNTLKAGTGLLHNKFAFDARLSNVTSDGYIDRAWVDMKSYYFSAGYYGEKSTLKFLTFGGNEKTYQAWYGVDPETMETNRTYNEAGKYKDVNGVTQFYDNQTDNYNQTHYQLHWVQELNSRLNMNLSAHLTRGKGYYEEYKRNRDFNEYGLLPAIHGADTLSSTDLVRQKWLDNYFYGLTYSFNYSTTKTNLSVGGAVNRYDGDHFGKVIWARYANNLDISKDWYRNKGVKDDANIYVKANSELFENLFLSADVQYRYILYRINGADDKFDYENNAMRDITQTHDYHFLNPKIGLTYKIDTSNDVYASYSISNREPNRNNYTERAKNEAEPTHETLYDAEAGYRFQSSRFSAGANLYFMNYRNQLILTGKISEIGEALTTNIDKSYRAGIEISLGAKITDWLNWNSNVTLSQNKILNFMESVPVYNDDYELTGFVTDNLGKTDIAFSPNVIANSVFSAKFNAFQLGLHSHFVGKQFLDNSYTNIRSIDAYFVNNLSAKYTLNLNKMKGIDFQLLVNNLFHEKYESNGWVGSEYYVGDPTRYDYIGYFPQAGINFLASVTLRF